MKEIWCSKHLNLHLLGNTFLFVTQRYFGPATEIYKWGKKGESESFVTCSDFYGKTQHEFLPAPPLITLSCKLRMSKVLNLIETQFCNASVVSSRNTYYWNCAAFFQFCYFFWSDHGPLFDSWKVSNCQLCQAMNTTVNFVF